MPRTSSSLVQGVLGDDYGKLTTGAYPPLTPYIDTASLLVDDLVAQIIAEGGVALSDERLEMIERWLAAHAYTKTDPTYSSKSTGGASGSFIRGQKEPEPYKDMALSLDPSGCLPAILNRNRVKFFWLGKRPSQQTDYQDRS